MAYLIFNTPEEAKERSAEAAKKKGLAFWKYGSGTKYIWAWVKENTEEDPRAYIEIKKSTWTDEESGQEHVSISNKDLLTEEEIASIADSLPDDWAFPSDPFVEDNDEDSDDEDDEEEPPLAD